MYRLLLACTNVPMVATVIMSLVCASLRSMYFYPRTIISGLANEVMKVWVIWGNNCIQNDKFLKIWQVSSTAVSYPLYPNLHFKLGTLSTVKQKSSWMYFCFAYVRDKSYYQTAVDKGYGQATMTIPFSSRYIIS